MTRLFVSMGFYPEEYFQPTVDYIAQTQLQSGAIPWFEGGILDPWDHVESAMGLTIGKRFDEARQAYYWLRDYQLENGSWLASYKNDIVEDGTRAESNFVAYVATGVWHYYLSTMDIGFLEQLWPTIDRAMGFVLSLQGKQGQIFWAEDTTHGIREDSLITGCSSIYKSFECALNIATVLDIKVPHWALARTRLGHALRNHPECFDRTWDSKSRFAMDWYYPVLTGVIQGHTARQHLRSRWQQFVVEGRGSHCVNDEPWVTVAESCELVMALLASGEYHRAVQLFSWLHELRDSDGSYWTGYVYRDHAIWPEEKPTWTAGAVLMAADALSNATPAAHLFREESVIKASQEAQSSNYSKVLE